MQKSVRIYMIIAKPLFKKQKGGKSEMTFSEKQLLLYAITDSAYTDMPLFEQVERALLGGATIIQLREKKLGGDGIVPLARELLPLCHKYGAPLIINDDPFIALRSGADGVHVGLSDMPVKEIREKFGKELIVGATAKTVEQAKSAEQQGADYIGTGAVFPSPTKKDAIRITAEQLRKITASVNIPAVAIGGINAENAPTLKNCGIKGIAVVSAIFGADDIEKSARALKEIAREIVK